MYKQRKIIFTVHRKTTLNFSFKVRIILLEADNASNGERWEQNSCFCSVVCASNGDM